MSPDWFALWWPAFLATLLSEAPIYALFLQGRLGLFHALGIGVALQCITHPLFWLAWELEPDLFYAHYDLAVLLFEAFIFLAEAAIVWAVLPSREPWHRLKNPLLALAASTTANAVSLVIGLLQQA